LPNIAFSLSAFDMGGKTANDSAVCCAWNASKRLRSFSTLLLVVRGELAETADPPLLSIMYRIQS
jgi:hypothetical protein